MQNLKEQLPESLSTFEITMVRETRSALPYGGVFWCDISTTMARGRCEFWRLLIHLRFVYNCSKHVNMSSCWLATYFVIATSYVAHVTDRMKSIGNDPFERWKCQVMVFSKRIEMQPFPDVIQGSVFWHLSSGLSIMVCSHRIQWGTAWRCIALWQNVIEGNQLCCSHQRRSAWFWAVWLGSGRQLATK